MAVKDKDIAKEPAVTRISASDTPKPSKKVRSQTVPEKAPERKKRSRKNPLAFLARMFGGIIGYFKGAWYELRQVRWPNRRATWGMTGALLGFTAFFIVFILLIDALFEYLFKVLLG